ncbi:hypothetical protein D0863_00169 [Hortaea werneckii]|uniref:GST N-terminal domain-containing protein n=1 Tax=Hortaea werneckii TaxID=91943 RepID=A0A3M7ERW1_HORWE|nr:hypothetical protein D0863_00169 [Hortaea werneckii]
MAIGMPCYTLVGSELSLFTGKIKTYLQWKGIPHDVLLPSDEVFKNIIIPGAGIAMIPVLLIHDDQGSLANAKVLQDTKEIMDYFESMYPKGPGPNYLHLPMQHAVVPPTPNRAFAVQLFELLADEWLLTQAMYWRWYAPHLAKQRKFLAMEFGNSSTGGLAHLETQQAIGEKRMARFAGFTPGLGVSETTSPALEWQFHELLKLMESHFDQFPFLLGDEISLADFAFWGSFGPHLGRDPVPSFIIKTEAPGVWEWIERVNSGHRWAGQHVRNGNGAQSSYGTRKMHATGSDVDDVPESTSKIMRFLMTDYAPILKATVDRTIQYVEKKGGDRVALPRALGEDDFTLRGPQGIVKGSRRVQTHAIWELDRIIARSFPNGQARASLLEWLESGCGEDCARTLGSAMEAWMKSGRHVEREKATLLAVSERAHKGKL